MRSLLVILGAALAGPATAAKEAQEQFDLVCRSSSGTETRYRVDLTRGEACGGECERIWKIGEVTTGQILLINTVPNLSGDLEERMTVNRITGEYSYMNQLGSLRPTRETGSCRSDRFSGFPKSIF